MDASTAAAWAAIAATLGIAIVGWHRANRADQLARRALELAEAAEQRASRLETAQFERGDVQWNLNWDLDTHTITATNTGLDVAHDVELILDPLGDLAGRRRRYSRAEVGPTASVNVDMSGTISASLSPAARARARASQREMYLAARVLVTWRTAAGVPGSQEWPELRLLIEF